MIRVHFTQINIKWHIVHAEAVISPIWLISPGSDLHTWNKKAYFLLRYLAILNRTSAERGIQTLPAG